MFNDFNNGSKIGLIIQAIAGVIMAFLVILDKPVPDFIAWLFYVGLILSIVSAFFKRKNNN